MYKKKIISTNKRIQQRRGLRKNSKKSKGKNNKKLKSFNLFQPVKIKPFSFNSKLATSNNSKPLFQSVKMTPIKVTPINSKTKNLVFGFDLAKPARKVKGKKALSWQQAKVKFPKMNPMGDADKDGVKNWLDCKPFDPKRQDTKDGRWIIEKKGEKVAGPFKNIRRARHKVDKLDNDYGAYVHKIKAENPVRNTLNKEEYNVKLKNTKEIPEEQDQNLPILLQGQDPKDVARRMRAKMYRIEAKKKEGEKKVREALGEDAYDEYDDEDEE